MTPLVLAFGLCGVVSAADEPLPPAYHEEIVVTVAASEQRLVDAVALASFVPRADIVASPDLALDDQLRQVPGFGLFRRSSSLAAHPTTQGVSLRGIGSSGASRTLVLLDGLPLNDPFGGWVTWGRVPTPAIESVEVVRGATSQLYGSSAMAGVVQLLTRTPVAGVRELRASYGSLDTFSGSAFASAGNAERGLIAAVEALDTAGYYALTPADRGPVDRPLATRRAGSLVRGHLGRFRLGGHFYAEDRVNGTAAQENDTRLWLAEASYQAAPWRVEGYAQGERFRSTFSRVLEARTLEDVTLEQQTPSFAAGASVLRQRGGLTLGADARQVAWDGREQRLLGAFAQKTAALSTRVEVLAGLRADLWNGAATQVAWNPRLGAVVRASGRFTARGSLYRGFRAPSLNELYRPFRVGNVETQANAELLAEALWGGDLGLDFHPGLRLFARANAFWNRLLNPISNVTRGVVDGEVVRQRDNLGPVGVRGFEAELRFLPWTRLEARTAWLTSRSRVDATGLPLPQAPVHQATFGLAWLGAPRVGLEARWTAAQFEDDRGELELPAALVVDLSLRQPLGRRLTAFIAAENVLDREVVVGRAPLPLLGAPRTVRLGFDLR